MEMKYSGAKGMEESITISAANAISKIKLRFGFVNNLTLFISVPFTGRNCLILLAPFWGVKEGRSATG